MGQNTSLKKLVGIYQRKHGPRLEEYLDYFRNLGSLNDAIHFACHGKDGKIHGHQRLVGKRKLEQARKRLMKHADEIEACRTFDDLLACVRHRTKNVYRFGVLAVYDTSLRLGAHLNRWPAVVYLHAGTKTGCNALNVKTRGGTVEMERLPKPMRVLEPYQAEDFLCIFKGRFQGVDGDATECLPKGC